MGPTLIADLEFEVMAHNAAPYITTRKNESFNHAVQCKMSQTFGSPIPFYTARVL